MKKNPTKVPGNFGPIMYVMASLAPAWMEEGSTLWTLERGEEEHQEDA